MTALREYREGGEGMVKWCEENVNIPIPSVLTGGSIWTPMGDLPHDKHPDTGRSSYDFWQHHKEVLVPALEMEDGKLKYRLIVFCWMRGEAKSMNACLIQLWKFFNFPRQQIMLGANSKDQIKFVHFDLMKDIIRNSPNLMALVGHERNLQEKEIRLTDEKGHVKSLIRSISSFSGIVSNITGYTFSEMFDMKKPKFFVQLDGSIRTMPNALGVIDSTVAEKTHVLYQLYEKARLQETKTTFFSYRFSRLGAVEDYWNPGMDQVQLDDYRAKFPFGEFERYFLNLWDAGTRKVFKEEMIKEMGIMGIDGLLLNHDKIAEAIERYYKMKKSAEDMKSKGIKDVASNGYFYPEAEMDKIESRFMPVSDYYKLTDDYGANQSMTIEELIRLGDALDTDWAILAGTDFGDALADKGLAKTAAVFIAKGLPGSRSNPFSFDNETTPKYLYVLLSVQDVHDHQIVTMKKVLSAGHEEYGGIDIIGTERYGSWDLKDWCEDRDIVFCHVYPNYGRQKEAFTEFFNAVKFGNFKAPPVGLHGRKQPDVLREEMSVFDHESKGPTSGTFLSPEKFEKYGIQDDVMYAVGWALYAGKDINYVNFRSRKTAMDFGTFINDKDNTMLGRY